MMICGMISKGFWQKNGIKTLASSNGVEKDMANVIGIFVGLAIAILVVVIIKKNK